MGTSHPGLRAACSAQGSPRLRPEGPQSGHPKPGLCPQTTGQPLQWTKSTQSLTPLCTNTSNCLLMTKSHQQGLVLELRLILYGHTVTLKYIFIQECCSLKELLLSRGLGQGPRDSLHLNSRLWCCQLRPPPTQHLTASTATCPACPPTPETGLRLTLWPPSSMAADKCQHSATRNVPPPGRRLLPVLPPPCVPPPSSRFSETLCPSSGPRGACYHAHRARHWLG